MAARKKKTTTRKNKSGHGGSRPGAGRPPGTGTGPRKDSRINRVVAMLSNKGVSVEIELYAIGGVLVPDCAVRIVYRLKDLGFFSMVETLEFVAEDHPDFFFKMKIDDDDTPVGYWIKDPMAFTEHMLNPKNKVVWEDCGRDYKYIAEEIRRVHREGLNWWIHCYY